MAYLFYVSATPPPNAERPEWAEGHFTLWRPSLIRLLPDPSAGAGSLIWWLFHHGRVFSNRDYCVLLVHHGKSLVHRAIVSPRYARFPFMARDDLQVGDVWTAPSHRGLGIASSALRRILTELAKPARRFWYVTAEDNRAARRAAENAGFYCIGEGVRESRWGIRLLGQYRITSPLTSAHELIRH